MVAAGNVTLKELEAAFWTSCGDDDELSGLTVRVTEVLRVADVPMPVTVTV